MTRTSRISAFALLLRLLHLAAAQVVPTGPGPNETYNALSDCRISWNPDVTGAWTNTTIDLMSGSNDDMVLVTNVAAGLDGTDATLTPYIWTCPDVHPYSNIYFYEFRNLGDKSDMAWTTRFTISSPTGDSTPPLNSKQTNGDPIPWGNGSLRSSTALDSFASATGGSMTSETARITHKGAPTELSIPTMQARPIMKPNTTSPSGFMSVVAASKQMTPPTAVAANMFTSGIDGRASLPFFLPLASITSIFLAYNIPL